MYLLTDRRIDRPINSSTIRAYREKTTNREKTTKLRGRGIGVREGVQSDKKDSWTKISEQSERARVSETNTHRR